MKKIIDDAFDIQKEKHLNKNNIIFKDKKFLALYKKMKQVNDEIKRRNNETRNKDV
tara:strand:+ start:3448 stop:3615 length:168 start_codon:yes stop_codon:yes gene_type:complete